MGESSLLLIDGYNNISSSSGGSVSGNNNNNNYAINALNHATNQHFLNQAQYLSLLGQAGLQFAASAAANNNNNNVASNNYHHHSNNKNNGRYGNNNNSQQQRNHRQKGGGYSGGAASQQQQQQRFDNNILSTMHGAQILQQQTQLAMQQALNNNNNNNLSTNNNNNNNNNSMRSASGMHHGVPPNTVSIADYLAQLIKDRKQLAAFPNVFLHVERILDEEICKVRASLFQISGRAKEPLVLPEPDGPVMAKTEKVYVPVKDHPDFNFVGRILGPRGMTAKQLEQETGCKIMVRGKGSMRDKKKEDANRGKPNWEHLNDELHVVISVEDTEKRAAIKIQRAVEEVQKLLVPVTEGEDELKKRQLMELAIINGTYRDSSSIGKAALNGADLIFSTAFPGAGAAGLDAFLAAPQELQRLFNAAAAAGVGSVPGVGGPAMTASPLRTGTPLGAPLILSSPRLPHSAAAVLNGVPGGGSAPPGALMGGADPSLLYHHAAAAAAAHHYTPADYHQYANALLTASTQNQQAMDAYATGAGTPVAAAAAAAAAAVGQDVTSGKPSGRRGLAGVRDHPYQRAV